MEKFGVIGYLLILAGVILMNFSEFFGVLVLIGGFFVAIAWIKLGRKSNDVFMLGNGIFIIILPLITVVVTILAILLRNFRILSYGILFVIGLCLVSFILDLLSHLNAYRKFGIGSFIFAFILRIVVFVVSAAVLISISKNILKAATFTELVNTLQSATIEILIAVIVVVLANLLSAHGFYRIYMKKF